MTEPPSADTIVRDIEFELMLGVAPTGDLGQALAEIRREQNRIRSEVAGKRGRLDARDVTGELLRLNDMLLGVLHEALSRLASLELVLAKAAGRLPSAGIERGGAVEDIAGVVSTGAPDLLPDVDLDVRPLPVPIAGRLIDRLRLALHQVALYYVRRFAEQQGAVNVYQAGEVERLTRLVDEQQRRLAALESELIRLRRQAPVARPGDDTEESGP